jgi:RNA-directed DNA polymerase
MIKASIDLQDLRRRIYVKAKAEPSWRFWGLYVHVCKTETLREAYEMAKKNDGAPGVDGVTFEAIEAQGADALLEQIRDELIGRTYKPLPARRQAIPKDGGKVRVLSIPAIRDRVAQGALKLILEPIFEADFQPGSFGYRPKRTAHDAVQRVAEAIVQQKTRVLDFDLRSYFDNVRHDRLLEKVAQRVDDADIMHLLKGMLKASGNKGVPQGGVISPLLSNLYLNEVDRMLERAKEVTRNGKYTYIEYARFADDLVILIDAYKRHDWLIGAVEKRLREEFDKLQVEINDEKSRIADLGRGESFGFLGFDFRYTRSFLRGVWRPYYTPKLKKRTALVRALKEVFRRHRSQPIERVINLINPVLRGWVNYFAVGHSSECFSFIKDWVEKKVRRHLAHAQKRQGFGWKRWNRRWLYDTLRLFNGYRVRRDMLKVAPAG